MHSVQPVAVHHDVSSFRQITVVAQRSATLLWKKMGSSLAEACVGRSLWYFRLGT